MVRNMGKQTGESVDGPGSPWFTWYAFLLVFFTEQVYAEPSIRLARQSVITANKNNITTYPPSRLRYTQHS